MRFLEGIEQLRKLVYLKVSPPVRFAWKLSTVTFVRNNYFVKCNKEVLSVFEKTRSNAKNSLCQALLGYGLVTLKAQNKDKTVVGRGCWSNETDPSRTIICTDRNTKNQVQGCSARWHLFFLCRCCCCITLSEVRLTEAMDCHTHFLISSKCFNCLKNLFFIWYQKQ